MRDRGLDNRRQSPERWRYLLFVAGPLLAFYFVVLSDIRPGAPAIANTLGVALWMALWWVAEIVPLAITSLLPVVLFPLLGIMNGKEVSSTYFNHIIFLFIGGFLIALAIQRWDLHRRIALRILTWTGVRPARMLLGFMAATAFLSMWISNTATTMMMVPILLSIILKLEELNGRHKVEAFAVGMLLSIAYSASIGGIATIVGTPPNLSFARIFHIYYPEAPEISFAKWLIFALPLSVVMFAVLYTYLYYSFIHKAGEWRHIGMGALAQERIKLGKMGFEEKVVAGLFVLLALLWLTRGDIEIGAVHLPGWSGMFPYPEYINDGTVAILVSGLLFVIPARQAGHSFIMNWKAAEDIPWEVILLFGGGFALASGVKASGLSGWMGEQLTWLKGIHPMLIVFCSVLLVTFLTELTSNTATVETFLPILAGLAGSIETNPLLFMLSATLAGSMAFMLPVATPPNAIVFGTRRIRVTRMMRTGLWLNLISSLLITLLVYYYGSTVFHIDLQAVPDWAK